MSEANAKIVPSAGRLSTASAAYDRGSKGYLSDIEKAVRAYDTDNDGKISTDDVFRIVEDVHNERSKKQSYKKFFQWSVIAIIILLVGNFGLVWATVALTKEVKSNDGKLEDADTGRTVQTRSEGFHVKPTFDTTSGNRKLSSDLISAGTISRDTSNGIENAVKNGDALTLNLPTSVNNDGTRNLGVQDGDTTTTFIIHVVSFDTLMYSSSSPTRSLRGSTKDKDAGVKNEYYTRDITIPPSGRRKLLSPDATLNRLVVDCEPFSASCSVYVGTIP